MKRFCVIHFKAVNFVHDNFHILLFVSSQEEKPIYEAFSQEEFMSKFISFLSLEDRKGKDKFNVHRFVLFKVRIIIPY